MKYIELFENFNQLGKDFPEFWIFGSEDSRDLDLIVSVDYIPRDISICSNTCKEFNEKLSSISEGKEVNSNLGIFKNGKLIEVFKGTPDEVNNSIWYTYKNHKQFFPIPISGPVNRDLDEKILRTIRVILSFYSRTSFRSDIKSALKGSLSSRLEILNKISFKEMKEFPGKKESVEDVLKVIAFQFGQVFSLIDGHESDSYTKSGISKNYKDLEVFLKRGDITDPDLEILDRYLDKFIDTIQNMKIREEETLR